MDSSWEREGWHLCPRPPNSWASEASLFLGWVILSSLEVSFIKGGEGRQLITQSLIGEDRKEPMNSVAQGIISSWQAPNFRILRNWTQRLGRNDKS